jgi:hypothetical protein
LLLTMATSLISLSEVRMPKLPKGSVSRPGSPLTCALARPRAEGKLGRWRKLAALSCSGWRVRGVYAARTVQGLRTLANPEKSLGTAAKLMGAFLPLYFSR